MLIEKECELIHMEKTVIEMQGISKCATTFDRIERTVLLDQKLHQFRVMFYLVKIEGNLGQFESNKTTNQVGISMFQQPCKYEIQSAVKSNVILINRLRIYYFFSLGKDITKFLNDAHVELSLTQEDSTGNKSINGKSLTKALANFSLSFTSENTMRPYATHQNAVMRIFNRGMTSHSDITMVIAMAYDGIRDTQHAKLLKYEEFPVYYPNIDYISSDIFPDEWMEIFLPDEKKFGMRNFSSKRGFVGKGRFNLNSSNKVTTAFNKFHAISPKINNLQAKLRYGFKEQKQNSNKRKIGESLSRKVSAVDCTNRSHINTKIKNPYPSHKYTNELISLIKSANNSLSIDKPFTP